MHPWNADHRGNRARTSPAADTGNGRTARPPLRYRTCCRRVCPHRPPSTGPRGRGRTLRRGGAGHRRPPKVTGIYLGYWRTFRMSGHEAWRDWNIIGRDTTVGLRLSEVTGCHLRSRRSPEADGVVRDSPLLHARRVTKNDLKSRWAWAPRKRKAVYFNACNAYVKH